jgi:hypothetical protein
VLHVEIGKANHGRRSAAPIFLHRRAVKVGDFDVLALEQVTLVQKQAR